MQNAAQAMVESVEYGEFITRKIQVGTRAVFVLDDIFADRNVLSIEQFLKKLAYELNDVDSKATNYSKHWKFEFSPSICDENPFFAEIVKVSRSLFQAEHLDLKRVHSNLHLYGDMQFPHIDSHFGVTALYYANSEWKENWLGETVFYDDQREPLYVVNPKPGRIVVFNGDIVHRAGVPSRECFESRLSLAFKFHPRTPPT